MQHHSPASDHQGSVPPAPTSATSSVAPAVSRTPSSSRPPSAAPFPRSSISLSRQSSQQDRSRTSSSAQRSAQRSPSLSGQSRRPPSFHALPPHALTAPYAAGGDGGHERDEVAMCQYETAMVNRENQMLRGRIRELERMVAEMQRPRQNEDEQKES